MRVRFLLYSIERANRVNRKFVWIGQALSRVFPKVKYDLPRAGVDISAEKYLTASFFSALVYGVVFFLFFDALFYMRDGALMQGNTLAAGAIGLLFSVVFFFIHAIYPGLVSRNYASGIDDSLLFALNSMLIQVSSGVSLFHAMSNVSKAGYGSISKEFGKVVQDISSGESEAMALEKLALKTRSEYLKKISWQLLTSLRSGASLKGALTTVVDSLNTAQLRAIRDYAGELNILILLYLMLAAAIPTLGITFLVILSAMGGSSIGPEHILFITLFAGVMQLGLIGFIKTRIPKVYL